MNCKLCENGIGDIAVLLPIKQPDGSLCIMTCLNCAENSTAYCKKHKGPHSGFTDDTSTACLRCIEEEVSERWSEAESIFNRIKEVTSPEDLEDLAEWAELSSLISGDSEAVSILRAIATKAARLLISIDEMVEQILKAKSLDIILPKCLI